MKSGPVVLLFNERNYKPGQWEAWDHSSVVSHASDLDALREWAESRYREVIEGTKETSK